jgi:hypothetical protein
VFSSALCARNSHDQSICNFARYTVSLDNGESVGTFIVILLIVAVFVLVGQCYTTCKIGCSKAGQQGSDGGKCNFFSSRGTVRWGGVGNNAYAPV